MAVIELPIVGADIDSSGVIVKQAPAGTAVAGTGCAGVLPNPAIVMQLEQFIAGGDNRDALRIIIQ